MVTRPQPQPFTNAPDWNSKSVSNPQQFLSNLKSTVQQMANTTSIAIALGVTTGFAVLCAIFIIARRKQMYISFIPGLAESRDRIAARMKQKQSWTGVPLQTYNSGRGSTLAGKGGGTGERMEV
ncbi:hypothetical protein Slin14017_G069300 [Septoria linicola]|nr:hypothetical protein Slin14017_G069300 [Septoria linicola]